jgi:hypothetical protein
MQVLEFVTDAVTLANFVEEKEVKLPYGKHSYNLHSGLGCMCQEKSYM